MAETLAEVVPDVVLLTDIDYDHGLAALSALADRIARTGRAYEHRFALRPNSGLASGLDLDGDGRLGEPEDAQGYGRFAGHGGMAILSRVPIEFDAVRDFSALLWRDLPGAVLPELDGAPFPSEQALASQRLSSTGHWDVPLVLPDGGRLHLLAFAAGPPVFDGPEDRNGLRNADEINLWRLYLDGALKVPPPDAPVIVIGNANLDPMDGDGRREAIRGLLAHERLTDPAPESEGGVAAAERQGGVNADHRGNPARDTADWSDDGPGNLRVSYVLPDRALRVLGAGVFWPAEGDPLDPLVSDEGVPRHHLVWVDLAFDRLAQGGLDGGRLERR